jgi:hypothetical protein
VVVIGVDCFGGNVFNGKLAVALAEGTSACVGIISTLGIAIAEALIISTNYPTTDTKIEIKSQN